MTQKDLTFFTNSLNSHFDAAFVHGEIDSTTCERIKSWLGEREAQDYARLLFRNQVVDIPDQLIRLQLSKLREIDGREFKHVEVVAIPDKDRPQRTCFVGHRFCRSVEDTLRWNLRTVFEPYGIKLDWSGRDPRSVQILEDIIDRIKSADFCIFDNRATGGRPNVYIEAGMCIVLQKPFILFEYEPRSPRGKPSPIPSDLRYAMALRYRNYKQLFRDFYVRLRIFIADNLPLSPNLPGQA